MKNTIFLFVLASTFLTSCFSNEIDWNQASVEVLIEQLALIDTQGPGLHGTASVGGFIGADLPLSFQGGVIGAQRPVMYPAMRELVRRGVAAMPQLVAHIADATPTKLVVGGNGKGEFHFMFQVYRNSYDPQPISYPEKKTYESDAEYKRRLTQFYYEYMRKNERYFDGPYTVKVGDVCFALIGQILGRQYEPVAYQPTAGLVINSPIESPELAEWVRRDWQDFTEAKHMEVLLNGARQYAGLIRRAARSLVRLRFYFPDEYARQAKNGELKTVIDEFEREESARARLKALDH